MEEETKLEQEEQKKIRIVIKVGKDKSKYGEFSVKGDSIEEVKDLLEKAKNLFEETIGKTEQKEL